VKFVTLLVWLVRLLMGAYPRWIGAAPKSVQRIYFANHSSHADGLVLWAALPDDLRANTRPVAAKDYWDAGWVRRHIATRELNVVMVERRPAERSAGSPLDPLRRALDTGFSLIIFPEGTRTAEPLPGPFKSGLYHLAREYPGVELIPVYLENLHRIMPKGTFFPVPLICTVRFGAPLSLEGHETKEEFLDRCRDAVIRLAW
jgi:1-acyl-sn-glycerol-3-phosphate acyltransferase